MLQEIQKTESIIEKLEGFFEKENEFMVFKNELNVLFVEKYVKIEMWNIEYHLIQLNKSQANEYDDSFNYSEYQKQSGNLDELMEKFYTFIWYYQSFHDRSLLEFSQLCLMYFFESVSELKSEKFHLLNKDLYEFN